MPIPWPRTEALAKALAKTLAMAKALAEARAKAPLAKAPLAKALLAKAPLAKAPLAKALPKALAKTGTHFLHISRGQCRPGSQNGRLSDTPNCCK